MTRSDAVRQEVKKLDGYRCAICGYDGRDEQFRPWVVPHHGVQSRKLGMGGSEERDTVDNCVALCSTVGDLGLPPNRKPFLGLKGEGSCHQLVEDGHLVIMNWDPETRTFDLLDMERRQIPHDHIWCYRRQLAEELEPVEACIQGMYRADGRVAYALWRLWKDDAFKALDPDAKSFKAYCEARDWRTTTAVEMAETYELSIEKGFGWQDDETMRAYKKRATAAGLIGRRPYFYVKIPAKSWLLGARPEAYYRTSDEQALRETMNFGDRLYKIGKTVYGLRAEGGKLFDPDGQEVNVVQFDAPKLEENGQNAIYSPAIDLTGEEGAQCR